MTRCVTSRPPPTPRAAPRASPGVAFDMSDAVAARLAAIRAEANARRGRERAPSIETDAEATTREDVSSIAHADFKARDDGRGPDAPSSSADARARDDHDDAVRRAVNEAIEREQIKTAKMIEALRESGEDANGGALERRAREAERMMGLEAARHATAMENAQREMEELRAERDRNAKELKKLRAHLLALEDEEDEVAEEQEREIDEAREEERREYERKLSELKKNMSGNDAEVAKLRATLEARDEEVNNLQKALGAYYAELEDAETRRAEAAILRQKVASLTSQAASDRAACAEAKTRATEAEARLKKFEAHLNIAKEECIKATTDASKLRKALHHALQKSSDMMVESEKLLDKRIVSDLFIAYLERKQAEDVLNLLGKMLGFSEKQKARMEALKNQNKKRGVLGKIARAPVSIAAGAIGVALEVTGATGQNKEVPVADLWVSFLEKQVADDEGTDENKAPIPTSSELISAANEL